MILNTQNQSSPIWKIHGSPVNWSVNLIAYWVELSKWLDLTQKYSPYNDMVVSK